MVSFNSLWREKFTLLEFCSSKSELCLTKEVFCLVFWPLEIFKWFKGFSILDGEHFKVHFVVRRSALHVGYVLYVVSLLFLLICLSLASVLFLVFLFFSVSLVFSFFFMFCWHIQHYGWVESFCCSKVLWQKLGTVVNLWPPPTAGSWWDSGNIIGHYHTCCCQSSLTEHVGEKSGWLLWLFNLFLRFFCVFKGSVLSLSSLLICCQIWNV